MKVLLSELADQDLEEIFDYSVEQFGLKKADEYVSGLVEDLEELTKFPESGLARNELQDFLKSKTAGKHIIFYEIRKDHIWVVRILHQSRDLPAFFG